MTTKLKKKKKARKRSKKDRILRAYAKDPERTAAEIGSSLRIDSDYVRRIIREQEQKKQKQRHKTMNKSKGKKTPTKKAKNEPKIKDGEIRGGNGRTDYSIKGVRKHAGQIEGLENMTMEVMIVDGDAAADVREAQAFVEAIQATLSGLEKVKEGMENPEHLGFHVGQVANIVNAAGRIKDKLSEFTIKRQESRKERHERLYKARAEWQGEIHQVEQEKEEAPASK